MHSDQRILLLGLLYVMLFFGGFTLLRHISIHGLLGSASVESQRLDYYQQKSVAHRTSSFDAYTLGFSLAQGIDFEAMQLSGLHLYDNSGTYRISQLKMKGLLETVEQPPQYIILPLTHTSLAQESNLSREPLNKLSLVLANSPHKKPFWREHPKLILTAYLSSFVHEKVELRFIVSWMKSLTMQPKKTEAMDSPCEEFNRLLWEESKPKNGSFLGLTTRSPDEDCWAAQIEDLVISRRRAWEDGQHNTATNLEIIKSMALASQQAGAKLVLINMPISLEYRKQIKDVVISLDVIEHLAQIPHLTMIDAEFLFEDATDERVFFRDPIHLNRAGAEVLAQDLSHALKSLSETVRF